MARSRNDKEAFILKHKYETAKAYLFLDLATGKEHWFPKSQVEFGSCNKPQMAEVIIPVWLAEKAGLL